MAPHVTPKRSSLLSRRSFVTTSATFAAATWLSACRSLHGPQSVPKFAAYPFSLGIASGEPSPDGMVLWTRLAPDPLVPGGGMNGEPVQVTWEISENENLSRPLRTGTAIARPEWGYSVHVEVAGLRPDRWYWYRFTAGDARSAVGRTRTVPALSALPARLRFSFASCQNYENGYYTALEHLAREENDVIVHLGDYIYEGSARNDQPRRHNGPEIVSLDDYRARYSLYKLDPALQAAHATAPWIVTWDDHEVDNNYAADVPQDAVARDIFLDRRAAAYQAYYEMMPLRASARPAGPDLTLYRRFDYGRLAAFHVLDTRQYRTDQPCGDGNKPPCDAALDPEGTVLGLVQRDWLFRGLERSQAAWNVLAQQIMMARVDRMAGPDLAVSMDQWPGYEYERRLLLRHFAEAKVKNPVVLTGDIHTNWANELIADFDGMDGRSVAVEFVGTSISSGGDGTAEPRNLAATLAENPFVKFHNAERGYVRCEVTPERWTTDYRTVPYISRPGAPITTRATFTVESGQPKLNRVNA